MEKNGLFQIGEVAKLFHVSISILRYYDKTGLVRPEYTDPDTGYRYYSTRQFECLNTIRFQGGHEQAAGYYGRLMNYIEENQLSITGFSKEITMIDYGLTDDITKFVTELQIPVG